RSVERGLRRLGERVLPNVADHADDRHLVPRIRRRIARRKLHANWITILEVALDEHAIDDRDRDRVREIAGAEIAAFDDGRAHRGKESRAREALTRVRRTQCVERLSRKTSEAGAPQGAGPP